MYQTLRSLQSTIKQREGDEKSDRTTVQFPPDVVWQLLSPQATTASRLGLSDYHGPSPGNGISTATLQITTTIVHPATEDELSPQTEVDAQDTQMPWEDVFDQPFLTNLLSYSLVEDYSWLPFN
ncbi:hypothetical protein NW754_004114 [Fusarium falciforme]|nr:hypothetical protein NW754_004114 [Fusarium falciforme]